MARIPVEKKSGAAWWPWLLALLLLALGGWLLLEALDDDPEEVAATATVYEDDVDALGDSDMTGTEMDGTGMTGTEMNASDASGPITSLSALLDAENPASLDGRRVRLSGVTASTVSGDSTYWVYNPDEGIERRIFAVLYGLSESESGPGTGADGRYNVDEGETMQIEGVIQAVEPSDPDAWGVTGEVERELRTEEIYIRARSLSNLGT